MLFHLTMASLLSREDLDQNSQYDMEREEHH